MERILELQILFVYLLCNVSENTTEDALNLAQAPHPAGEPTSLCKSCARSSWISLSMPQKPAVGVMISGTLISFQRSGRLSNVTSV